MGSSSPNTVEHKKYEWNRHLVHDTTHDTTQKKTCPNK